MTGREAVAVAVVMVGGLIAARATEFTPGAWIGLAIGVVFGAVLLWRLR